MELKMFEQVINVDRMEQAVSLFGSFDENIKLIESIVKFIAHNDFPQDVATVLCVG